MSISPEDADFIAINTTGRNRLVYRRASDGRATLVASLDTDEAFDTFCAGASARGQSLWNDTTRHFECGTVEQLQRSKRP